MRHTYRRRHGHRDARLFPLDGVLTPSAHGLPTPDPALVRKAASGLNIVLHRQVTTTDELYDQLTRPWTKQYAPWVRAEAARLNEEAAAIQAAQGLQQRPAAIVAQISHLYRTEPFQWVQGKPTKLLGTNLKTEKSDKAGIPTKLLALSPPRDGSGFNLCPFAGVCKDKCLIYTGKNVFDGARAARIRKTLLLHLFPRQFLGLLHREIAAFARTWNKRGIAPAIRLNGFSDIAWERLFPTLFSDFAGARRGEAKFSRPTVRFYDYTKWPLGPKHRKPPRNYHLTYSWSERKEAAEVAATYLAVKLNVAVVVAAWPPTGSEDVNRQAAEAFVRYVHTTGFLGTKRATLADDTDARFNDGAGGIAVLFAKGNEARATLEDVQSGEVLPDEAVGEDGMSISPIREFILRVDPITGKPRRFAALGLAARKRGMRAPGSVAWWRAHARRGVPPRRV